MGLKILKYFGCFICSWVIHTAAQAAPKATINWSTKHAKPGEIVQLQINVKDMPNVYGVQLKGNFNSEVLGLPTDAPATPITIGKFLKSEQAFTLQNQVDTEAGSLTLIHALIHPALEAHGNGGLIYLSLLAKAEGDTKLNLDTLKFGTKDGQVISPEIIYKTHLTISNTPPFNFALLLIGAGCLLCGIGGFAMLKTKPKRSALSLNAEHA